MLAKTGLSDSNKKFISRHTLNMTQYLTNVETYEFVYKYLKNPDILYELLYRAEINKLGNDIKTDIESNNQFSDYEKINVKSAMSALAAP